MDVSYSFDLQILQKIVSSHFYPPLEVKMVIFVIPVIRKKEQGCDYLIHGI